MLGTTKKFINFVIIYYVVSCEWQRYRPTILPPLLTTIHVACELFFLCVPNVFLCTHPTPTKQLPFRNKQFNLSAAYGNKSPKDKRYYIVRAYNIDFPAERLRNVFTLNDSDFRVYEIAFSKK